MTSLNKISISKHHCEIEPDRAILFVLEGSIWCLPKGSQDSYNLLEKFVIRCFSELISHPSPEEIAQLLGFPDARFVSHVTNCLQLKNINILVYQSSSLSNLEWEVFDPDLKEINSSLKESAEIQGLQFEITGKYGNLFSDVT